MKRADMYPGRIRHNKDKSKKRTWHSDESGAVAVVVALSMAVLFGFTSFAVDYGAMASTKQKAQNAVDAAALAGAKDLCAGGSGAGVMSSVNTYCSANGFDVGRADTATSFHVVGDTVTVEITKQVRMGFSQVLTGQRTRQVRAEATAEATTIFGGGPYAMFAGQKIEDSGTGIVINGNNIHINGNIHSNSDINMSHAILGNGAVATAVHNTNPSGSGWSGGSIALDMPKFASLDRALSGMSDMVEFSGSVTKNSHEGFQKFIEEAVELYESGIGGAGYTSSGLIIHVPGNLTFHGHNATAFDADFPITLIVDGNIDLNGAQINSSVDYPMTVMSKNGNITVNGGGAEYSGIIYAPNGDVTINGNDASFVGRIVGQNIFKNGGMITVDYDEDVDRFLPKTKVHLIN